MEFEKQNNLNEQIQTPKTTGGINWDDFENADGKYISLVIGKKKTVKVVSVEQTIETIPQKDKVGNPMAPKDVPALKFKVTMEDGKEVDKEWSVTSKQLAKQLRPLIANGLPKTIEVVRYGVGYTTSYEIGVVG